MSTQCGHWQESRTKILSNLTILPSTGIAISDPNVSSETVAGVLVSGIGEEFGFLARFRSKSSFDFVDISRFREISTVIKGRLVYRIMLRKCVIVEFWLLAVTNVETLLAKAIVAIGIQNG